MVRAFGEAESLPLLNSPRRHTPARGGGGGAASFRRWGEWVRFSSYAGTLVLCCAGVALYITANGLATGQEQHVRVQVSGIKRHVSVASGNLPGVPVPASGPATLSSSSSPLNDLLRLTSAAMQGELPEPDVGAFFPEKEALGEESIIQGRESVAESAEGGGATATAMEPVAAAARAESKEVEAEHANPAMAAVASQAAQAVGTTPAEIEATAADAAAAEATDAGAAVADAAAANAAAADAAAADAADAGSAAAPDAALTAGDDLVAPAADAESPAGALAEAPANVATTDGAGDAQRDPSPDPAADAASDPTANFSSSSDLGHLPSATPVHDALVELQALQVAIARGDDADLHLKLGEIVADLEGTLTAAALVVADSATNVSASAPAFLNGGLPHYIQVPALPKQATVLAAGVLEADPEVPDADAGAGPATMRELVGLHAEPDLGRAWPTRVVMVASVYDEWDEAAEMPVWANNSADPGEFPDFAPRSVGYTVAPLYQRRHADLPGYVPNHGYEGGAYLKFVVDYYDNLPDVAVFLQADADAIEDLPAKLGAVVAAPDAVSYQPINVGTDYNMNDVYIYKRDPYQDWWSVTSLRGVEQCWRSVAGWFGYSWPEDQVPQVSLYCCNYFAVSRANIRRVPREVWEKVYNQLIVKAECVEGAGPVGTRDDDKWQLAITLEHLAHVMFGGHFPHYPRQCSGDGAFRDQCCDGTSCGAKGLYYMEGTDWLVENPEILNDSPLYLRRPPDDLPEEEWAENNYTVNTRRPISALGMATKGVRRRPNLESSPANTSSVGASVKAKGTLIKANDEVRTAVTNAGQQAKAAAVAAHLTAPLRMADALVAAPAAAATSTAASGAGAAGTLLSLGVDNDNGGGSAVGEVKEGTGGVAEAGASYSSFASTTSSSTSPSPSALESTTSSLSTPSRSVDGCTERKQAPAAGLGTQKCDSVHAYVVGTGAEEVRKAPLANSGNAGDVGVNTTR